MVVEEPSPNEDGRTSTAREVEEGEGLRETEEEREGEQEGDAALGENVRMLDPEQGSFYLTQVFIDLFNRYLNSYITQASPIICIIIKALIVAMK